MGKSLKLSKLLPRPPASRQFVAHYFAVFCCVPPSLNPTRTLRGKPLLGKRQRNTMKCNWTEGGEGGERGGGRGREVSGGAETMPRRKIIVNKSHVASGKGVSQTDDIPRWSKRGVPN